MDDSRERQVLKDFETRAFMQRAGSKPDVSDGRVLNRLRNRDKVIDALIELVLEGKLGTLDEVVERSGVARRSIFRHFTDLSDMMLEAFRRVVADSAPRAVLKDLGIGTFEDRVQAFVEVRLSALEMTHPFGVIARARLAELEVLRTGLTATTEMIRAQIANHFAAELANRPTAEAERLIDAVYLVGSFESYDVMVHQLRRPIEAVGKLWADAIHKLLGS